jgi:hypothetical protein
MAKRIPPSILKGILSLLGNKVPKWLTNLINKTKGGKEYVENIIEFENPPGSVERLKEVKTKLEQENKNLDFGFSQLFGDLQGQMDKQLTRNDETLKEAVDKLKDSEKMATSMEEEVKRMIDQVEDLNQKMKLLNPDDDDPTYHAKGGITTLAKGGGFHKGLWESIMKLGTSMGISPKEQLKTFIELGFPITEKLKRKFGITEKESAEGLEWLILKNNPDLAKQPYSKFPRFFVL